MDTVVSVTYSGMMRSDVSTWVEVATSEAIAVVMSVVYDETVTTDDPYSVAVAMAKKVVVVVLVVARGTVTITVVVVVDVA